MEEARVRRARGGSARSGLAASSEDLRSGVQMFPIVERGGLRLAAPVSDLPVRWSDLREAESTLVEMTSSSVSSCSLRISIARGAEFFKCECTS